MAAKKSNPFGRKDNPKDSPAKERAEKKKGIKT